MNRRQVLVGAGIVLSGGLGGCLQATDAFGTPRGTATLPTRLWVEEVPLSLATRESLDPIRFDDLTEGERAIVRTAIEAGEYTTGTENDSPALGRFRDRVEGRTDGGLVAYLVRNGTYYRVGYADGDHVVAHPDVGEPSAGAPTRSRTEPTGDPSFATCDETFTATGVPESVGRIPDPLTRERVVAYVERLERAVVLPEDRTEGYVSVGDVTVEEVPHGYVAYVSVTGGYFNRPGDAGTTETVHYDLGTHTASYFLGERVVRRARTREGRVDPRENGEVVVCRPD